MSKIEPTKGANFPEPSRHEKSQNKSEVISPFYNPHTAPKADLQKMDIEVIKSDSRMARIRNLI